MTTSAHPYPIRPVSSEEFDAFHTVDMHAFHGSPLSPEERQLVVFHARPISRFPLLLAGMRTAPSEAVRVDRVVPDASPLPRRYEPGHPDADGAGYVSYPNVNPVMEMTDLLSAVRSYQLNAAAVQATKSMLQESLQILS